MAAPRSQKAEYRPIGFLLQDLGNRGNDLSWVRFNIRPEELTVQEPSRTVVQQTLGGAWLDNFGPGIKSVSIAGHTGWRARYGDEDGFTLFKRLRDTVFESWHAKRAAALEAGRNPDLIQLIFVDELDELVYLVAPMAFSLRRSKSRPLLMQYQMNLLVLSDRIEADSSVLLADAFLGGLPTVAESSYDDIARGGPPSTPEEPIPLPAALQSLKDSLDKLKKLAKGVNEGVDKSIGEPVRAFMDVTTIAMEVTTLAVSEIQGSVDTATASTLAIAGDLTAAGRNINQTVAAIQSLPGHVKARFMEISAAYGNAFCVLRNSFKGQKYYADYSDLYGAGYCSSTAGGRPLSPLRNENPFFRTAPVSDPPPITMTPESQSAVRSLANLDVLNAEANDDLMNLVSAATAGISVQQGAA